MFAYLIKRLLLLIPTLIGVVTLTFVVIQFVPGGPIEQMMMEMKGRGGGGEASGGGAFDYRGRRGVDAEKIKEIRALYGFDKSPVERYFLMLGRFARFDLGESYFQHRSVWDLIKSKLPVSISIGLWTFFLTYLIAVPLGIARQNHGLPLAHHAACHGVGGGQLCRHHHADEERVPGGNPQTVCADRA